jgi:hypothetical protein
MVHTFNCPHCTITFNSEEKLMRHIQSRRCLCPVCGVILPENAKGRKAHIFEHYEPCDYCNANLLIQDMQNHLKEYHTHPCEMCAEVITGDARNIAAHIAKCTAHPANGIRHLDCPSTIGQITLAASAARVRQTILWLSFYLCGSPQWASICARSAIEIPRSSLDTRGFI